MEPLKPFEEIDWALATEALENAFPGASLSEIVERAESAANDFKALGEAQIAEALRRSAKLIRKRAEQ